ncbi:MAG TPA: ABC transporter ATP-binding protein [Thermovirgaceae bacterium]|jgi:osmoprotectant transport system ATP-binding protein|nr:ABC transporter ATP-binding protein [Thermovirgaceae bacterium]
MTAIPPQAVTSFPGAAISLRGVRKNYGGAEVVRGVDLDIPRSEILVLIGPSGCGKTTILRMINRLVEPSGGSILIDGEDTSKMDPVTLRRRMGYVIQGIGLFPHMRISANVSVVPRLKGVPGGKAMMLAGKALDLVGLPKEEFGDKWPRQLSGGQQQRVGVARALAGDPEIILMDEPFGALDPISRIALQDEFLDLQARLGKTIVFVTHDINEAMKMGSRIAIMRDGAIAQEGEPLHLLSSPADDFVADFVGAGNPLSMFSFMKVRDVPVRSEGLPVVDIAATIDDARRVAHDTSLKFCRDRFVYVVADGRLCGSARVDNPGKSDGHDPVLDILETASSVRTTNTVQEALGLMVSSGIANVAVTGERGKFLGVLSFGDMVDIIQQQREKNSR